MSQSDKSSDLVPDIDVKPADGACMPVKFYFTWQLVNRLPGDFRSLSGPSWPESSDMLCCQEQSAGELEGQ